MGDVASGDTEISEFKLTVLSETESRLDER
jgi:hypothetical protein